MRVESLRLLLLVEPGIRSVRRCDNEPEQFKRSETGVQSAFAAVQNLVQALANLAKELTEQTGITF